MGTETDAPQEESRPLSAGRSCQSAYLSELDALSAVIESLAPGVFAEAQAGQSPIGAHVRHCVDHSQALLDGVGTGIVDYEQRHRGVACESDPALALALIADIRSSVEALSPEDLAKSVCVHVMVLETLPVQQYDSTVLRELLFLLAHQHHHHASIAALAKAQGCEVPRLFALAPSTRAAVLHAENAA